MDPFTAIAAVSSIVQLVDFSAKLISKSHDLYRKGSDTSVGAPVFEAAAADLRILNSKLNKDAKLTGDPEFQKLYDSCDAVTAELLGALRKITGDSKQKIWTSIRKALKSIWSQSEIDALERRLATIRQQLSLRLTVDLRELIAKHEQHFVGLDGTAQQILKAVIKQQDVFTVKTHTDLAILTVLQRQDQYAASAEQEKELAKLPSVPQAAFNSIERQHDALCLKDTRTELLSSIEKWITSSGSKHIFWLSGLAGTGKSTISGTVAQQHGYFTASFCFSRGGGDVGHARKLFTSIARQLADRSPILRRFICDAIRECTNIPSLSLYDQWRYLILTPLSRLGKEFRGLTLLIVVDALDECDDERDIRAIISLLSEARSITTCQIRIFLTSRPDNPIRYGFYDIQDTDHTDVVLHDISRNVVDDDIKRFLVHHFAIIRKERLLPNNWPGDEIINQLVQRSSGLFIWADTVCRFIREGRRFAKKRLDTVLKGSSVSNMPEQTLDNIYLTVLDSSIPKSYDAEERGETCVLLREVLGSLVVLTSPHTIASLAALLRLPPDEVEQGLEELHAIIDIPPPDDLHRPIRLHHPSLRDFLLHRDRCTDDRFWIDSAAAHHRLYGDCVEVLSEVLVQDICNLRSPGARLDQLDPAEVQHQLPMHAQYACINWAYHLRMSQIKVGDDDQVHNFLCEHLLHWLEALSVMGKVSDGVTTLIDLETYLKTQECPALTAFVHDAKRFVLDNRWIMENAPLQIYSSSLIFAPAGSLVRAQFEHYMPSWIVSLPETPPTWGPTLLTLEGHTNWVRSLAFSPDGRTVASSSADKTVKLWDTGSGALVQTLEGHTDFVYSVAYSESNTIASGSTDKTVRLWDSSTGAVLKVFEGHTQGVRAVAFGPERSRLLASGACDTTVRIWNLDTGQAVRILEGHSQWVYDIAFSQTGLLAAGSADKTVTIWHASTGQLLRTIDGYSSAIRSVSFAPAGNKLASVSSDNKVWLADICHGESEAPTALDGHSDWVYGVAFAKDGKRIASVSADRTVRLWDVDKRREIETLHGHSDWIYAVAFSPDGTLLATGGADKSVRIWDVATSQPYIVPDHKGPVHTLAMSSSGNMLASAAHDDLVIKAWNRPLTSAPPIELEGHSEWIHNMVFSPDCTMLASCSDDTTIRIWDLITGESVRILEGHNQGVRRIAFSPDASFLATASDDKMVMLWDLTTFDGKPPIILNGHSQLVQAVAFSPDGARLASGSDDGTILFWRLYKETAPAQVLQIRAHNISVRAVAFSPPSGGLLASTSPDGEIKIWNTTYGDCLQVLRVPTHITTLAYAQSGPYLRTNRGVIPIDHYKPEHTKQRSSELFLDGHWVTKKSQRLLWLPPLFRATSCSFQDNTFFLGHSSGFVSCVEFEHEYQAVDSPRQAQVGAALEM